MILLEDGQDPNAFLGQMYAEYQDSGIEPIRPDFSQPRVPFPASCPVSPAFLELEAILG